jgi:hypothetical protein
MRRTCSRTIWIVLGVLLLVSVGWSVSRVGAEIVEFPREKPVFTVTFPDNWIAQIDGEGSLTARPNDGSGVLLTILALEGIGNEKAARSALTRVTDQIAKATDVNGLKKGEIAAYHTERQLRCLHQEARGRDQLGADIILTTIIFSPDEGQYFVLVTHASPSAEKAHESELTGIVQSIEGD